MLVDRAGYTSNHQQRAQKPVFAVVLHACASASIFREKLSVRNVSFEKNEIHTLEKKILFFIYVWFHGLPSNTVKINFHFDTQCLSESLIHFVNR